MNYWRARTKQQGQAAGQEQGGAILFGENGCEQRYRQGEEQKIGKEQIVAMKSSKEIPPIKNGNASKGTIASKSANTSAAALNNLLTNTSPGPKPLKKSNPNVCSRLSWANTPEASRGTRRIIYKPASQRSSCKSRPRSAPCQSGHYDKEQSPTGTQGRQPPSTPFRTMLAQRHTQLPFNDGQKSHLASTAPHNESLCRISTGFVSSVTISANAPQCRVRRGCDQAVRRTLLAFSPIQYPRFPKILNGFCN